MAAVAKDVEQKVARAPSKTVEAKPKASKPKLVKVAAPAFKDENSKVITGLPAPAACPFCRRTDCTIWTKGDEDNDPSHFVRCEFCGGEGPFARTQLEAANFWNSAATADPAKNFDGLIDGIAPAPPVVNGVDVANQYRLDNLSLLQRRVLVRGLKVVLDNSNTDEEFEQAQFLSNLLADFEPPKPKKKQFANSDDGSPIDGLPEPEACPFCGFHEYTDIVTVPASDVGGIKCDESYHVQCDGCFAEGSPKSTKLEAAQHWNKAAKKVDYSILESLDAINLKLTHLSEMLVLATDTLRNNDVDIDAPVATCLEAALDTNLESAREGVEAILKKLSTWKSPALERLGLTG